MGGFQYTIPPPQTSTGVGASHRGRGFAPGQPISGIPLSQHLQQSTRKLDQLRAHQGGMALIQGNWCPYKKTLGELAKWHWREIGTAWL